jgi:hypothetical protein
MYIPTSEGILTVLPVNAVTSTAEIPMDRGKRNTFSPEKFPTLQP